MTDRRDGGAADRDRGAADRLLDTFGRAVENLRISVTDRCDFRCVYCMPAEGLQWMAKAEILTYEEIVRLVRAMAPLGVTNLRLTGGEPLLRQDLPDLVREVVRVPGIRNVALTTNGTRLEAMAAPLAAAGLHRVNVSLDALDPARFTALARRDRLDKVLRGLAAVEATAIRPIKLNAVVVRGMNDEEILPLAELARTRPFVVRFIEFMPIGKDDGWGPDRVVRSAEVRARIHARWPIEPVNGGPRGTKPADRFRFSDGAGEIGFVSSVSEPFCAHCNRIRLTADGKLRNCLFSTDETDLKTPLRAGASDRELTQLIRECVWRKKAGHEINEEGFIRPIRTMSQIGG